MNAFNFFIKKLSTEQKIDFKTAVQAYRVLSKEEKDVYIEMSRKAKIQYKHDLATYLFSLPPDEQAAYLNKLEAPKRTRVKKEKIVHPKNGDDVEEDVEDDEEIGLQTTVDFEDSTIPSNQIEVIATQDSPDFDEAADNRIEVIDVYTIKTEFDPLPTNNDHQAAGETSRATTKSKSSDKASKSKASGSKSLENSRTEADESSPSKANSSQNESDQQTPRKSSSSKSLSMGTDDESISSNVSEKKRDKAHKRKRREEAHEEIIDFENKKIKQEIEEPSRVPS